MTNTPSSSTELSRIAHSRRELALKQRDVAMLSGGSLLNDDDSHLDLTTRIRFLEACGGPPPFVLERIDASGNVDRYQFERPFLIVGRSPACDVVCHNQSVSFRHVYLQSFNGVVWWFDLDSRSGVIHEGQKRRAGCLLPGMTITAGDYSLRLAELSQTQKLSGPGSQNSNGQPQRNTLIVAQLPDLPQVALEFENGKVGREGKQLWPIENSITLLGRRSCCDLRFTDESVSRVHASLVLTGEGLWIVDLLGRGGTKVNGVHSAYAYLHDGSLIEIGPYKVRVRYQSSHSQSHPAEAVLDEEDRKDRKRPKSRSRRRSPAGSVSEDLVYDLVTQMAQMQKQMFDQSQMQIGLLVQMLGSIHQSQQDMLRRELDRVHEITKEMHELQLRLTAQNAVPQPAAPTPPHLEPPQKTEAAVPSPAMEEDDADVAAETEDSLPAPSLFERDEEETADTTSPESWPRARSDEVQDHAVLFQRMQSLDRERNSRLQKIFRAFRGS